MFIALSVCFLSFSAFFLFLCPYVLSLVKAESGFITQKNKRRLELLNNFVPKIRMCMFFLFFFSTHTVYRKCAIIGSSHTPINSHTQHTNDIFSLSAFLGYSVWIMQINKLANLCTLLPHLRTKFHFNCPCVADMEADKQDWAEIIGSGAETEAVVY